MQLVVTPNTLGSLDDLKPGDVVRFTPGRYVFKPTNDAAFQTKVSGEPGNPIRYQADPGACLFPKQARVLWQNLGSHVQISGFELTGNARIAIENYGSSVTIDHCHIHHIAQWNKCDGLKGGGGIVQANWQATNNSSLDNEIHDIAPNLTPDCLYIHGIYYTGPGGYISRNLIYRCSGWGIHCYHTPSNITIVENTIVGCRHGGIIIGADAQETPISADCFAVCRNRVFFNANYGIGECGRAGPNNFFDGNWCYGNPVDYSLFPTTRTPTNTIHDSAEMYRKYA